MKLLMLLVLSAVVVGQDPRLKLVDAIAKLGEKADIGQQCQEFASKNVRVNSVALVAASTGSLMVLAGGQGQPDGLCVAVLGAPKGRTFLVGGNGGKGGKAGRSGVMQRGGGLSKSGASGASSTDPRAGKPGQGGGISNTVGEVTVQGSSGYTGDGGPTGDDDQFPTVAAFNALDAALEPIAAEWAKATPKDRQKLIDDFVSKNRPSAGVVAAWSADGKFAMIIAANGTATNPNGISIDVVGTVATHVVIIAGDKHGKGKPGKSKGPTGSFTRDGK